MNREASNKIRWDPAYYAHPSGTGGLRDWLAILHVPYTVWNLAYVIIGSALAPHMSLKILLLMLIIFLLGLGVSAHALDEVQGRPLRTGISSAVLICVAAFCTALAGVLAIVGIGTTMIAPTIIGVVLMVGYNLELFGGQLHHDLVFAIAWGSFPLLTAFFAQTSAISLAAVIAAFAAFGLSLAQRILSTAARRLRRQTVSVTLRIELSDGSIEKHGAAYLVNIYERVLRCLTWTTITAAVATLLARIT